MQPTPKIVMESDVTPSAILDYTDVQAYLKLDGTSEAPVVNALIAAATKKVEEYLGRKLITQVWSIYYDYFPREVVDDWWDGSRDGAVSELYQEVRFLELPFGPCGSVYFVKSFNESDDGSVFDASYYSVDTISPRPKIALKSGSTWPSRTLRPVNGVQVKATFGYGSASQVPTDIKEAIKMITAKLYEHRGDGEIDQAMPKTAQMILESHRVIRL